MNRVKILLLFSLFPEFWTITQHMPSIYGSLVTAGLGAWEHKMLLLTLAEQPKPSSRPMFLKIDLIPITFKFDFNYM
jgi:hypothetical protein